MHVSDVAMTADARGAVRGRMFVLRSFNHFGNRSVALATCIIGDLLVPFRDLDRVGIIARREIKRMPETVLRLRRVFTNEVSRGVTVVAGRHAAMARLDPAVVLLLHDVAIHASLGIIGHVGATLGVNERESADSERQAQSSAENDSSDSRAFHLTGVYDDKLLHGIMNAQTFDLGQGGLPSGHWLMHRWLLACELRQRLADRATQLSRADYFPNAYSVVAVRTYIALSTNAGVAEMRSPKSARCKTLGDSPPASSTVIFPFSEII